MPKSIVAVIALKLVWLVFIWGGTAYVVFWRGYSGWWFLLALIVAGGGISVEYKDKPAGRAELARGEREERG